jgi:peptidoglycan L-alanyl-D-glutamate endopeptidase CwlK
MTDVVSENRLMRLHPKVRDIALTAYREAVNITPVGVHPFITETLRTFKESDDLYAQGRTKPGQIVTNAKGGSSYHNYGMAIDFVNQVHGLPKWVVNENWMKVVGAFKKYGFVWGGDFKSIKDNPHFEMTFGYDWRDLLKLYKAGKIDSNNYVLI